MEIKHHPSNDKSPIDTKQENNWGGGDSERKAALLEEGLMNLFKTKKEIYKDEVDMDVPVSLQASMHQGIFPARSSVYVRTMYLRRLSPT